METSEYHVVELALQRMGESSHLLHLHRESEPTHFEIIMGIFPICALIILPIIVLIDSNMAKGHSLQEDISPTISTIIFTITLFLSIIFIAFRHHSQYEFLRSFVQCNLWLNLAQLIVSGCFLFTIKNNGEYSTYCLWLNITTIPTLVIMSIPVMIAIRSLGT